MNEDELTQKDIDDYNKRRNEEYQEKTKANKEIRKKQEQGRQLDIPGLDQQLGGTAFEIGANLALDAGTSWLLGVPEGFLSKGLYGIANVGGSAIINAIAQKMRGDKFSLGELVGTSAASLIPGAVTGKGVARSALRGATTAGVEQNIRSIVDDNKVLGFGDQVSAFATGGVLGTGFDFAGKGISKTQFFQGLAEKMNKGKSNLYADLVNAAISDDSIVKQGGSVIIPPTRQSATPGSGGGGGSGPTGKITARNLPRLEDFLSGNSISLDRTTAGLIQNPNFKLNDFLSGIEEELPQIRAKYPRIDVDTNLQRFKWQWHHINPDKMPVDFYVGLNNVNDRNVITDTLLRETGVSAGMNPTNRIGLPTEVHDEITDWLDTEIGRRSEVITQKISDDFGFGLTLTGPGSRAAKLRFNQLFASVPIQQRLPYIREYGEKIAESTQILDDLMRQFDVFYEIPSGFRLDIDVNTMERMLARLDDGAPTIETLREIIAEVTDGLRIPATDNLGRQAVATPRDPKLIRAIDIEGMLRDHKAGQSVLDYKEIRALGKELNEIYQLNLDIKGASTSAYIRNWYKERFGGTRKTGKK